MSLEKIGIMAWIPIEFWLEFKKNSTVIFEIPTGVEMEKHQINAIFYIKKFADNSGIIQKFWPDFQSQKQTSSALIMKSELSF